MTCEFRGFGDVSMIVCSRGSKGPIAKSLRCNYCAKKHTKLCDFPGDEGKTCDKKLCDEHARHVVGQDVDYCVEHAKEVRQ
jgi:hypothetical protein